MIIKGYRALRWEGQWSRRRTGSAVGRAGGSARQLTITRAERIGAWHQEIYLLASARSTKALTV